MTSMISPERQTARLKLVEEHIRFENEHDLDGIMATFGAAAHYEDGPWGERFTGYDEVRTFYADMLQALPTLTIDVRRRYQSDDVVVLEVVIRGRHLGSWRGLPATGREIEFPLCGIFTFDDADRLAGEKIYYDRASLLRQLGMFHEPDSVIGRIVNVLAHPLTMARIVMRMIWKPQG